MRFDFDDKRFDQSYAQRMAHPDWNAAVSRLADPAGHTVADIGCGAGIYSRAFLQMGAKAVIGVEPSDLMRRNALRLLQKSRSRVTITNGTAASTQIADQSVDLAFSRAVVHHLDEIAPFLNEAMRILVPGGKLLIQDRTMEDVNQPFSETHLRGAFFERFPHLLDLERKRRPEVASLALRIQNTGFVGTSANSVWETRRTYKNREELCQDLAARTGRSLLHALSDLQLAELIAYVAEKVPEHLITERDRWTFWIGQKPA